MRSRSASLQSCDVERLRMPTLEVPPDVVGSFPHLIADRGVGAVRADPLPGDVEIFASVSDSKRRWDRCWWHARAPRAVGGLIISCRDTSAQGNTLYTSVCSFGGSLGVARL